MTTARAQSDPPSWVVAPSHLANEQDPAIILDGAGGAFVAFKTFREVGPVAHWDMFVARLFSDAQPDPTWNSTMIDGFFHTDGEPAVVATTAPGKVWLITDKYLPETLNAPWFVRSVGSTGVTVPDASVAGASTHWYNSTLALPSSRLLVASKDGADLVVSFVETDGSLAETSGRHTMPGSLVAYVGGQRGLQSVADASGGAWVLGEYLSSSGELDLAVVRVTADGSAANTPAVRVVCSATRDQTNAILAPDGADGVYVAWTDYRDLGKAGDIFAAHVLADGSMAPGWPFQGKPIASMAGDQYLPSIATDGADGIWLAWIDGSSGENNLRFTHVLADGSLAKTFPVGGLVLCDAVGGQIDPRIAADGDGGFYALWRDARDGEVDLFGQHIHSTGVVMPGWDEDGLPISTDGTLQRDANLVVLDPHHALAAWTDSRLGYEKVFAAAFPAADLPVASVSSPRPPAISLRAQQTPARETIELLVSSAGTGAVRVALHDLSGRRVAEHTLEGPLNSTRVRFDTRTLEPGLYFARAWADHASASARVSFVR